MNGGKCFLLVLGQIVSLVMLSNNTVITFKRLQSRSLLLVSFGIIQAEQFILITFVWRHIWAVILDLRSLHKNYLLLLWLIIKRKYMYSLFLITLPFKLNKSCSLFLFSYKTTEWIWRVFYGLDSLIFCLGFTQIIINK